MEQQTENEGLIARYLLGELPEEEQVRVEDRFFTDDEYFELLSAVEYDLIDDYVNGELTERERQQFEKHFLASPKRRQQVEYAKALMKSASATEVMEMALPSEGRRESVSWWQSVLASLRPRSPLAAFSLAATLVVGIGFVWLVVETGRLRNQLGQLQEERSTLQQQEQEFQQQVAQQRQRSDELAKQLDQERIERNRLERELAGLRQPRSSFLSFILTPGLARSIEGAKKLVIPSGTDSIQLQLDLDRQDEYRSYRAELRTADGDEVWSQDMLRARPTDQGQAVFLTVPARLLASGDYLLTLSGLTTRGVFEAVGSYQFSVVRR
jgi:anti-sigma factor RsiW